MGYLGNMVRNAALWTAGRREQASLYPVDCCYLVTWRCNLRCAYCYESLATRPASTCGRELSTEGALRALAGIRQCCDIIVLSGGEPTTRADLGLLLRECRKLGFHEIILNTNGVRLPDDLSLLDDLHQVMLGLDALTADGFVRMARGSAPQFEAQRENLDRLLSLRERHRFDVCLSSVVMAEHLDEAERILEWCTREKILVAFSPHVADLRVEPSLRASAAYREFAERLVQVRRGGGPLMGSVAYYEGIRDLAPFDCVPMANLTVNPSGEFRFPCGEADTVGPSFAEGRPWREMVREARQRHGEAPRCRDRCHFGCRLALTSLVQKPWQLADEGLHLLEFKEHSLRKTLLG